jgi:hypothetical protein
MVGRKTSVVFPDKTQGTKFSLSFLCHPPWTRTGAVCSCLSLAVVDPMELLAQSSGAGLTGPVPSPPPSRSSPALTLAAHHWCREFITWCDSPSESGTKKLSFATQKYAEVPQIGWCQHGVELDLHMGQMPLPEMPSAWVRRCTCSRPSITQTSGTGQVAKQRSKDAFFLPFSLSLSLSVCTSTHTHTHSH